MRMPTPRISATPIAARPAMKSQSAHQVPAASFHIDAKGPSARPRQPAVGCPPLIQALASVVLKPQPKVLSRNAHRNVQPKAIRTIPKTYWAAVRAGPDNRVSAIAADGVGVRLSRVVMIPLPFRFWPGGSLPPGRE